MKKWLVASTALWVASASLASADCGIPTGSVRILSNDFAALHAVADWASRCASPTVTVTRNQTTEHSQLSRPALSANPAVYTTAVVANGSLPPLLNAGLLRPLDDLVARFGQDLSPRQLIRVDGQIYAIAFMANAQHFVYRADILEQVGLEPPTTYEEVLAAAQAIREAGILQHPFALNVGAGWGLAQEFNNMYLGMGGEFFQPGTAEPAIENERAVAALHMLRDLSGFMNLCS